MGFFNYMQNLLYWLDGGSSGFGGYGS